MNNEQQWVYQVLITPIKCERCLTKISMHDGIICSPQKYRYNLDEDMCDFAVGFYEQLYADILPTPSLLDDGGFLSDIEFAGDTIHSFNTIANLILEDRDSRHRSPMSKWPDPLVAFHKAYRCLANYWLLPMRLGRTSPKLNRYDSMDLFLNRLEADFSTFREKEIVTYRGFTSRNYFRSFEDFNSFCGYHYVVQERDQQAVGTAYKNRDGGLRLATEYIRSIHDRAARLASSDLVRSRLVPYFESLGLPGS